MFLKLKPCLKLTEDLFHEVWTGDVFVPVSQNVSNVWIFISMLSNILQ